MPFIAIIIIIILLNVSSKKNKEIAQLKAKIRTLEKRLSEQTSAHNNYSSESATTTENEQAWNSQTNPMVAPAPKRKQIGVSFTGAPIYEDDPQSSKKITKEKSAKQEHELKNSLILAAGAFLVIIAAVCFLYSTWNITSNFLKIATLSIIAVMFFGMSYIARNKFKINQTADTFLYIGLAYIPVVLFAFSILNLVGDFFSISGAGKYIYLAGCSLIIMALYLILAIKNKDSKLYIASRAMRLAFICFLTANFSESENVIMSVLAIYSVFANIYKANTMPLFKKEGVALTNYFTLIVSGLCIPFTLLNIGDATSIIFIIVATLNSFIFYAKNEYQDIMYWAVPITVSLLPFIISSLNTLSIYADANDYMYSQIIHISYLVITFLLFNFKSNNLKNSFNILTLLHLFILATSAFSSDYYKIPSYIISLLGMAMYYLPVYKKDKNHLPLFAGATVINYAMLLTCHTTFSYELINVCLVLATTIFSLSIFREDEYYKIIPILGMFAFLGIYPEILIGNMNLSFILLVICIIALGLLAIINRSSIIYTISSFIFLATAITNYDYITNFYIEVGIFILFSLLQCIRNKGIPQTISQLAFILATWLLYQKVLVDTDLSNVTALYTFGILVAGIFAIRFILSKHFEHSTIKIFEYIFCGLIYLNAISAYLDPLDLMYFIFMLVVAILATYKLKFGPAFLCSIISIIVSGFILTAGFWIAIPLWIYLVAAGIVLLTFATKNEINQNKQNLKAFWQNTKEKFDL